MTVLSTDDPVRVFQRFSTLNAVSNGRAEVILGRGSFTESYPLFGYDMKRYEELFEDKLRLFAELIKPGPVSWSGSTRSAITGQVIYPPIETGSLRTWVGVGGSPESVVRAARYGLPLTLAIIGGSPHRFQPYVDLYYESLGRFGKSVQPVAVHSPGHVAATDDQAKAELWPHYEKMISRIGAERGWPPPTRPQFDRETGPEGALCVGSPETVAAKIAKTIETLGLSRFDLKYSNGTMPHEQLLSSIELFGTQGHPASAGMFLTGFSARVPVQWSGSLECRFTHDSHIPGACHSGRRPRAGGSDRARAAGAAPLQDPNHETTTKDVPGLTAATSLCAISDDPEYGTTKEKPIQVGGGAMYVASRETKYLSALRGPEGQGMHFKRNGSTRGPDGTILDQYTVDYKGIEKALTLYLDALSLDGAAEGAARLALWCRHQPRAARTGSVRDANAASQACARSWPAAHRAHLARSRWIEIAWRDLRPRATGGARRPSGREQRQADRSRATAATGDGNEDGGRRVSDDVRRQGHRARQRENHGP